jgi:hypothetical protein
MPVDQDRPGAGRDDAADDRDQRGLARAIRPEQREDLAALDFEIDVIERLVARAIGLADLGNRQDGSHWGPRDERTR